MSFIVKPWKVCWRDFLKMTKACNREMHCTKNINLITSRQSGPVVIFRFNSIDLYSIVPQP